MTNKRIQEVKDALQDAFELGDGDGEIPDHIDFESTRSGNVKLTYNADEGVGEKLTRYYIGNVLRGELENVSVSHETSGSTTKTFVRW